MTRVTVYVCRRYHVEVEKIPDWYAQWRVALGFDRVEYGVGGIQLFRSDELARRQVGFAVASNGGSLVGDGPGDWRPEWVVIGHDTACGDPVFASDEIPYPVFTAMHGEGSWDPKLVAPSLEAFTQCLMAFQRFAAGRSNPVRVDANPPTSAQQAQFLTIIRNLTDGDEDALGFWAVQIELDLDAFMWPT
jgi:hypothetical protein